MCHRLETGDAEAFTSRRAGDDRGARIQLLQLVMRDKALRAGDLPPQRSVPGDDEVQVGSRLNELEHALLRRQTSCIQDLRRLGFRADLGREVDAARDDPHLARAERPSPVGEVAGRRDHELRAAKHTTRQCGGTRGHGDVRPPHLDDVRLAAAGRDPTGRKPVGVQEVRFDGTGGAHEARKQRRDEQTEPGPAAQVAEHTVAVRDPVVPKLLRPDHLHVDAARANVFDRVGDETAGCITRIARV